MLLGFKRSELLFIVIVIALVAGITKLNLIDSYRKSRDVTRKNDLGDIQDRIERFKARLGFYPANNDQGQIMGCDGYLNLNAIWIFKPCNWGKNTFNSPYFDSLPIDPKANEGYTYYYLSNGKAYQIYVGLEGKREDEYDTQIVARGLHCGSAVCSAGRTNLAKDTLYKTLPDSATLK